MTTTKLSLIALTLALTPAACLLPQDQNDRYDDSSYYDGPDGSEQTGDVAEQQVTAEQVAPVVQAYSDGIASVIGFASPMAKESDQAGSPATGNPPSGGQGAQAQQQIENHKKGMLEDPDCADFRVENLAVVATFDNCRFKTTGVALDGQAAIGISVLPLGLHVDFEDLTVGERTADGSLKISVGGSWEHPQVVLGGDLRFVDSQKDVSIDLDKVALTADENGAVLDGGCDLARGADSFSVDMNAVRWNPGQCHPSEGSVDFNYGNVPITVVFLPNTPADGIVQLQIGSLPATEQQLLEPCAD